MCVFGYIFSNNIDGTNSYNRGQGGSFTYSEPGSNAYAYTHLGPNK